MRSKNPVTTVGFWYSGKQDDRAFVEDERESCWPHVGFWLLFIGMIFVFAACGAR